MLFNFKEPTGNAVEITCLNCGKAVAVTQWDLLDNSCQGGYSAEQSSSRDGCVDLTTKNDNSVRDCSTNVAECSGMEPSSTLNTAGDSLTKVPHCCSEDLKFRGCPEHSSSKKGMDVLKEMFANVDEDDLLLALKENNFDLEEAISDILIKSSPFQHADEPLSPCSEVELTLKDALKKYQKIVDEDRCKIIDVDRAVLWKTALIFYKGSSKEQLHRKLNVMFEGMEHAVDAGALSLEFFADLVRTIVCKLFEGKPDRRLPKYSWENVYMIKMAGVMVAHSLLQKGPGMPCLAPYVYEYLVSGEREHAAAYVNHEDLPETSQTEVLKELVRRVEDAQSDEDIHRLCDEPKFSSVIDTSGWPIGRVLIMSGLKVTL